MRFVAPFAALLLAASLAQAAKPVIQDLETRAEGPRVLVSFRVSDAFDDDVFERIHSGIPVVFRYRADLVRPRGFPLFIDKRLGRTDVETEVVYNGLTRQYTLRRSVAVANGLEAPPPASLRTSARDVMMSWMTELHDIAVAVPTGTTDDDGDLRVEVECSLGRRFVWYVFPGVVGADAREEVRR